MALNENVMLCLVSTGNHTSILEIYQLKGDSSKMMKISLVFALKISDFLIMVSLDLRDLSHLTLIVTQITG